MNSAPTPIQKRINLSSDQANRLSKFAQVHQITEDKVIEKALDILFSLTELLDPGPEHQGWSSLSENALRNLWNNEEDAAYDKWKELYGVRPR